MDVAENGIEENDHHGVPRSFQGSNDRATNLSIVPVAEHNSFHDIAGYLPPDAFMRKTVLSTVGWHDECGRMLPPGFYRDIFPVLTPKEWSNMYEPEAVRLNGNGEQGPHAEKDRTKSAIHFYFALWDEQRRIAEGLRCLGMSEYVSRDTRVFSNSVMQFFRNDHPAAAIHTYLMDTNRQGEFKWTKPMKHDIRRNLVGLTKTVKPELMTGQSRREMLEILLHQQELLQGRTVNWQPNVKDRIDAIAEYGQKGMQRLLGKFLRE